MIKEFTTNFINDKFKRFLKRFKNNELTLEDIKIEFTDMYNQARNAELVNPEFYLEELEFYTMMYNLKHIG